MFRLVFARRSLMAFRGFRGDNSANMGSARSRLLGPRLFGPPNVPLQPRRLTIAPAAVGCKRLLGRHFRSAPVKHSSDWRDSRILAALLEVASAGDYLSL